METYICPECNGQAVEQPTVGDWVCHKGHHFAKPAWGSPSEVWFSFNVEPSPGYYAIYSGHDWQDEAKARGEILETAVQAAQKQGFKHNGWIDSIRHLDNRIDQLQNEKKTLLHVLRFAIDDLEKGNAETVLKNLRGVFDAEEFKQGDTTP